jgi:hypothetical protein
VVAAGQVLQLIKISNDKVVHSPTNDPAPSKGIPQSLARWEYATIEKSVRVIRVKSFRISIIFIS